VKVIPFHRRMPVLGAAASLLIAATAGLAYWRSQGTERLPRLEQERRSRPAIAAPTQAPATPESTAPAKPKELQRRKRNDAAPETWSVPTDAGGAKQERIEEAPKPTPQPATPPAAPAALADQAQSRGLATAAASKVEKKAAKSNLSGYLPSGGPAVQNNQMNQANQLNALGRAVPQDKALVPEWTLEALEDGRTRVRILWAEGHLVLLRRVGEAVTVLVPASLGSAAGRREAVFLVPKGEDALDLYVLPEAPAHPAALPAEGPVAGFRQRLRPR
jgi:hypothetical protein